MKKVINIKGEVIEVPDDTPCHPASGNDLPCMYDKIVDSTILVDMAAREVIWEAKASERKVMAVDKKRIKQYGSFGDQIDMIYRQLRDGTTEFTDHITNTKNNNPK